ncbi:hypothetical protein PQI66_08060 [Corynebacterium sp. USCH3]|uniref:hypothetical protein n=1 Tax=Corynebacterium sp. USCH3 TaxID=3024840 RepID=UPI0030B39025
MTKKLTKTQRIEQKVDDGLSRVEAELAVAREDAEAMVARAEARAKKEQAKVDAAAVEIIRENHPDVWEQATDMARAELEAKSAARSQAAKGTVGTSGADAVEDSPTVVSGAGAEGDGGDSWQN